MYLRTVLNTEKLSSEITDYLTVVGRGFKNFSPDLIRIVYCYSVTGRRIDPNNFFDTDEDIIIRVFYQSNSFDCYVSTRNLSIDNIPFGDIMYQFTLRMQSIEEENR